MIQHLGFICKLIMTNLDEVLIGIEIIEAWVIINKTLNIINVSDIYFYG